MIPHWTNASNLSQIPTPCYLINQNELKRNLSIIQTIKKATDCRVLLALKGFATVACFDLMRNVLDGVAASSIYEARLGHEEFQKEIHGYGVALSKYDMIQMNRLCHYLSFNSIQQLNLFKSSNSVIKPSLGLRINPMVSTVPTAIYDPCRRYSRLGVPIHDFDPSAFDQIDGLHFHALCEQNTDALHKVLDKIKTTFGDHLKKLSWINWGGGHHITRDDYDINNLIKTINHWKEKYDIQIILEPGEAIGFNCGYYVTRILDIIHNEKDIAICDISATAHMPDVLEYPYRPYILGSGNEKPYNYIIGGNTCLAGDIIGHYSFDQLLKLNDSLVFSDMAHYTIVKTSNFNGVPHPFIGIIDGMGNIQVLSDSNYFSFKDRLS